MSLVKTDNLDIDIDIIVKKGLFNSGVTMYEIKKTQAPYPKPNLREII